MTRPEVGVRYTLVFGWLTASANKEHLSQTFVRYSSVLRVRTNHGLNRDRKLTVYGFFSLTLRRLL